MQANKQTTFCISILVILDTQDLSLDEIRSRWPQQVLILGFGQHLYSDEATQNFPQQEFLFYATKSW